MIELREHQVQMNDIINPELIFTKTVLILNTIWVVSRVLDMVTNMLFRLTITENVQILLDSLILIEALRNFSNLILFTAHSLESFIYFKMDNRIRGLVLKF